MGLLIRTGCQVFPYLGEIGVRLQVQLCSANWISTRGTYICQLRAWAFFFQENVIFGFTHCSKLPKLRSMPALKQSWLLFPVLKSEIIEDNSTLHLPPNLLASRVWNPVQLASSHNTSKPPLNPRLKQCILNKPSSYCYTLSPRELYLETRCEMHVWQHCKESILVTTWNYFVNTFYKANYGSTCNH